MKEKTDGIKITGAPSYEELHACKGYQLPPAEIKNPVAVIECIEEIPCNPCETACPQHAITVGKEITAIPVIDIESCTGCGICVAACPGLAIYLKQRLYAQGLSYIAFPFEYLPLPKKGELVKMVDRYGQVLCNGTVVKVVASKRYDRTAVIYATYPNEYFEEVVSMKRLS